LHEIGKKIGSSDKIIARFLKDPEEYGIKKPDGPKESCFLETNARF